MCVCVQYGAVLEVCVTADGTVTSLCVSHPNGGSTAGAYQVSLDIVPRVYVHTHTHTHTQVPEEAAPML